ncbi:MAG: phosphopyruvate hydratase [Planctomycetes bacterium]|nr:phosphopyruvate hydratase [Planctomycetota bacterium]
MEKVRGREILDSRGRPTVEAEVAVAGGASATARVPSGASTGTHEALELRDGDPTRYAGRGVRKAVSHIDGEIAAALRGKDALDQEGIDRALRDLDGTPNKSRLGANAILAASMACARVASVALGVPLHERMKGKRPNALPVPMLNVLNGGAHADNNINVQEFMLVPVGAPSFAEGLRWGCETYDRLRERLRKAHLATAVGDEGGFAPDLASDEEALRLLIEAIVDAGYRPGEQVAIALDVAATELCENGRYTLFGIEKGSADDLIERYRDLCARYPIISVEDPLAEDDWEAWGRLTAALGSNVGVVGDDLYVTSPERLRRGIAERSSNAILIKLNQVGTVSETLEAVRMAHDASWTAIVSHRSGETEDTFIADLAVGTGCGWIKTGAPCRSERVAKYNRLLRIEESLPGRYGARR